jgi:hypothetical protein
MRLVQVEVDFLTRSMVTRAQSPIKIVAIAQEDIQLQK